MPKMKSLQAMLVLVFCLNQSAWSQILSPKELKDVRGSIASPCFTSQRASQINSIASDQQIRWYCSCYAETIILPNVTVQELHAAYEAMQRFGNEAMITMLLKGRDLHSIAHSCSSRAMQLK